MRVLDTPATPDSGEPDPPTSSARCRVQNIGNDQPIELLRYVEFLEDIQPGDVPATWADVDALRDAVGFAPATSVEEGVGRFVAWYREFYGV